MLGYENSSVISRHVLTATADITISQALALMVHNRSSHLFVIDQKEALIGVFNERDLVRLIANQVELNNTTLGSVMTKDLITITETEVQDMFATLNKFRQHNIRYLPVVNNQNNLIGIITPQSLREMIQPLDLLRYKRVSEVMSSHVVYAPTSTSILELTQTMSREKVSCVVIVENQPLGTVSDTHLTTLIDQVALIPTGIITEFDIVQFCNLRLDLENTTASTLMSTPLLIKTSDSMWTAHQVMQKHQIRGLIVTDENNFLAGIITQKEIVEGINDVEIIQTLEMLQDTVDKQASELKVLNQQLQEEVNHRRLFEKKLQSSEAQLRAIFEAMTDILLVISTDGNQIETVQILPAYSGYEEQLKMYLASKTVEGFYQQPTAPLWLEKVEEALQTQQIINFDYTLQSENNDWHYSANISPITENKVLWVARDISKRKCMEVALQISEKKERQKAQQLEVALTELKHAEAQLILNEKMASLGRLVGGIAHEINNPNNFIYGNIQHANEYAQELISLVQLYQRYYPQPVPEIVQKQAAIDLEYISQDFPKLLTSIQQGAERISNIVRLLQSFSRLERPQYKKIDIHQCLDQTIQLLEHRLQAQSYRPAIQILKEYNAQIGIECYPGQINQVFMSIIANAIDAIEEAIEKGIRELGNKNYSMAPVSSSYGNVPSSNQCPYPYIRISTQIIDSYIVIKIANNGAVITAEILPKIFDPFFTTKAPGKGTGLGLSISYKIIVEAHGGQLRCHSNPSQDTEFVISLPLVQPLPLLVDGAS
ncbi:MAG: CBS domain-containing protein [Calothrix sp. C42_A2020_038]|nr:CBS domain-containing protein [Calothrix sp. C42_A2020_038]